MLCSKHQKENSIRPEIVEGIKKELDQFNPFVEQFRTAGAKLSTMKTPSLKMVLLGGRQSDGRSYNLLSASKVAALIVGVLTQIL